MARKPRPSPMVQTRLDACRRGMKKHGIDAYLITHPPDYFYLIGFTGEVSAVLVRARDVHVISDMRFDESINLECPWVHRWMRRMMLVDEIANVCKKLKIRALAGQFERLTVAEHAALRKLARGTKLTAAPSLVAGMRTIKDKADLDPMRRAIRVAEDSFNAVREQLRPGMTELDVAAMIEFEMKSRGASGASFPTISAEGPNAALPHAHPGRRRLKRGSLLLLDWGARVDGYCSDLTRVLFIGTIPPRFREVYQVVLDAQLKAIEALRPGMRMCDIDAVARDHVARAGYGDKFDHGLGHGLGLEVHEAPSLSWRSREPLAEGMVVTVEPGIYLRGAGGVRIEDDVLITARGARVLSHLPKSLDSAVV